MRIRNIATLATVLAACNPVQETVETTNYVCDQFTDHPSVEQVYRGSFEDLPLFMHGFLGLTKRGYERTEDFVICVEKDKAGNAIRSAYGNARAPALGESNGFPYKDLQVDSILKHNQPLTFPHSFDSAPITPYVLRSSD